MSSKNKFKFSTEKKVLFLLSYIYYLLLVPFEVKKGRLEVIYSEIMWVLLVILKKSFKIDNVVKRTYFETRFGKFHIKNNLEGLIVVSPSFERIDSDKFTKLIKEQLKENRSVLLIDVGAYFGDYSIKISNILNKFKKLEIIAMEPDLERYNLLVKNIKLNKNKNIKTLKIGLGNDKARLSNKINIDKLDNLFSDKYIKKFDHIFIKLDIDGYESEVLDGANKFINKSNNITLLIEDFVERRILRKLDNKFTFLDKISTYNSFWIKK